MNYYIKSILKQLFPSRQRLAIKKKGRHLIRKVCFKHKTSLDEMRSFLVGDFGIEKGDRIIVSSSFGNLNANFSPKDLVLLLMDIVGEDGLIMMPYYPPINSIEWANKHKVFDVRSIKSGMGVVTNVFAHMPGVKMSRHPTKAVCVWGNDANYIVDAHDVSTTPFYFDSPYGKMLKLHSKSLGLGVKNITTMHAIEDILTVPHDYYYQDIKYELMFIDAEGNEELIKTLVHDEAVMNKCLAPGDYVKSLNCSSYRRIKKGYDYSYVIDNDDLFEKCKEKFERGYTRVKK